MANIEETPTFNLKAVIQETGLKPDTLRAWERRYGLPQPNRTSGGHRLYSQRDIDMLKWLVARQEEGLSISRAVALWRQLEAEGQDPLLDPAYGLAEAVAAPTFFPHGDEIVDLREAWLDACLEFDESTAEQVLTYAFALYPAETVCVEILLKGLAEIGEGWYRDEVTVQQEHFTAELTMRRLEALVSASPGPTRPGRIMIGCAPEDQHTFPPLLLTFLLRHRGWEVVYLGARVPVERLEATAATVRPHLVILTAQTLASAATLLEASELLQKENVPLAFGGRIFTLVSELRERIPGHFLGEKLETAPQMVERILTSSPPLPPAKPVSENYKIALDNFRQSQKLLEAEMLRSMRSDDMSAAHLSIANQELARNIEAALVMGDIDYLCTDIEWVEGLLENYQIRRELLSRYLQAYWQAAQTHLDESASFVVEWLARLNGKGNKEQRRQKR
jgi:DNA-binding transcriptional MerR regulator/methylmalonyl-CoA mutase cobalamin-binding subunit